MVLNPDERKQPPLVKTPVTIPHRPGTNVLFCLAIEAFPDGDASYAAVYPLGVAPIQHRKHLFAQVLASMHHCILNTAAQAGDADQFMADVYAMADSIIEATIKGQDASPSDENEEAT